MIDFIFEPLQYSFIQRALFASILVGLACAVLGIYVVLRKMAFIGHALSHSALPGLVIAYLCGYNLFGGAIVATVLTALGIGLIVKNESVYEDTAIGIVPIFMFAFGILLISTTKSYRDLSAMLFGNILGVGISDMIWISLLTLFVIGTLFLFHKEFELFSVDPYYAKAIGINLNLMRYGLLFLLALTVVTGIQAVGTILTNALLIVPVASARLLTNRLRTMMILAAVIAVSSGIVGIYISYYFNVSSGAAIVLMTTIWFVGIWLLKTFKNK
ncbi:MAG: metal ABC transporter permease [Candidatus Omnitrophica bacterium]|nr:metal ABC transporter permease [Candidatus Omnitrophota bacterium]MCB9747497.1 metal ABC transporter permease [Candidatus Omnitrophota bacterium]